ncbi:2-hydroxy-3-keto-5-methylthiopentenyl-1-phosphate phosphatase [Aeribacillus pallidus]|uniref:2-hydroxy-3-keto-5-methylthiopentenyl-1- phosphate phosphatase n=1 Tax=Aeribacillus pallidus TaxID=33936 RepID=UPI003D2102B7
MSSIAIFCDFDGTITEQDNIISLMEQFAPSSWESLKNAVLSEQMSIQEGVGKMFSLLPTSLKEDIVQYLLEKATIREGFAEFVHFTNKRNIPFYVVSGGIDFFVNPLLSPYKGITNIYCNRGNFTGDTIRIEWPYPCDDDCLGGCGCCKPSLIRSISQNSTYRVVIGDSITDWKAAQLADFVLARGLLLEKCREHELPHAPFENFFDCIYVIEQLLEVNI